MTGSRLLSRRYYDASEIYVDGRLVQRFGAVGKTPETEDVYNPNTSPINIVLDARGEHFLAVRHSCMELRDLSGGWGRWSDFVAYLLISHDYSKQKNIRTEDRKQD